MLTSNRIQPYSPLRTKINFFLFGLLLSGYMFLIWWAMNRKEYWNLFLLVWGAYSNVLLILYVFGFDVDHHYVKSSRCFDPSTLHSNLFFSLSFKEIQRVDTYFEYLVPPGRWVIS
jgi:hypothetical protein